MSKFSSDLLETRISSRVVHKGHILKLTLDEVKLPNGNTSQREVVHHPGGVVIIPRTHDGKFVLVEQFRYAIGQDLLEFPAGRLNHGETDPMRAAARELAEETGYSAEKLESLGRVFSAPGFCNERLFIYMATGLLPGIPHPDEDEFVRIVHLTKEELKHKVEIGEIHDAKTLACWGLIVGMI
jgi:ADP-ribose pyrophosphatase